LAVDAALVGEDEAERLAAVRRYDVLDTPPDGAFDRVTALAARHFGVPISIVSIVDSDRIWFKSRHGVDVEEIGRDPGLCASAILHERPWIVEDAAADPRTLANPLVAGEFGLRFYAGAPLKTQDGFNLGTLCVIDREPRELSPDDARTLEDLAAIVVDELELRLSARTAVAREHELRDAAERTARVLQESLLPAELPVVPGADLAAFYRPADRGVVGGDFYDAFAVEPGRWALVIGDVSGKGTRAAAVTALARHTIRTASLETGDPADVLRVLNRAMLLGRDEAELERFCTAHVGFLEASGSGFVLRSASAGHPAALVLRRGAAGAEPSAASGPPVGWHADARFTAVAQELSSGDVVALHTDGLSEARRGGGLLGEDAIGAVLERMRDAGAEGVVAELSALLADPGVSVRDDAAALVLAVR
jgi:sigma-B regulation protein RsbU (phosphoserine phosphatase)